jgi:deoxyribonuclease V
MQAFNYNHLNPQEAVQIQASLRKQLQLSPLDKPVRIIGGADISFNRFSDTVYAGIVLLAFPSMEILHRAHVVAEATFPYVPGLLSFRELPALAAVWGQLPYKPDVLVLDGQGIAHPRRMGIATHFGILAGTPTIGCAKSRLTGSFEPLPDKPLAATSLMHKGEKIGEVLRTKQRTNPVFVSPGNLITQKESTNLIRQCVGKYRIPEPTRQAHLWVNEVRLASSGEGTSDR